MWWMPRLRIYRAVNCAWLRKNIPPIPATIKTMVAGASSVTIVKEEVWQKEISYPSCLKCRVS